MISRRSIYIVLVIILSVQFMLLKTIQEPYPAIIFPGFGAQLQDENNFYVDKYSACLTLNGECIDSIAPQKLLLKYPIHMHGRIMANLMEKSQTIDHEEIQQLRHILYPFDSIESSGINIWRTTMTIDKKSGEIIQSIKNDGISIGLRSN